MLETRIRDTDSGWNSTATYTGTGRCREPTWRHAWSRKTSTTADSMPACTLPSPTCFMMTAPTVTGTGHVTSIQASWTVFSLGIQTVSRSPSARFAGVRPDADTEAASLADPARFWSVTALTLAAVSVARTTI